MFLLIARGSHTRIHDTPRYKEKKTHTHTKIQFERERNIEKLESKYSIYIYIFFFFKPNIFSLNQHFSTSGFTLHKLFHLQQ